MKKILIFLISIFVFSFLSAQNKTKLFPEFSSWKLSTEFEIYTPDNLWDYIDGAAENYVIYDFADLHIGEYTKGKRSVRVEIYRHSNHDNAFGIYSSERYPDFNFIDIGTQGYMQDDILNFFHRNYYVKMYGNSDDKKTMKALKELAMEVQDALGKKEGFPATLKLFPEENKMANADKYIAKSFLGHEFLNKAFVAKYKTEEGKLNVFIISPGNNDEAEEMLSIYLDFTSQDKKDLADGEYLIEDPYNGQVLIHKQKGLLIGSTGFQSLSQAREIIRTIAVKAGNNAD